MKKQDEMTSFERMKAAVCEMVKEDLGVEAVSCKSHTSQTLKVVAYPDKPNTVEVFVPYQVFVGAKTNEVCADWDVNYWKMAFRQLALEFGVATIMISSIPASLHSSTQSCITGLGPIGIIALGIVLVIGR